MIEIYLQDDQNDLNYIYNTNSDYEIINVDYETTSLMAIFKMLSTNSLFDDKKLIIVSQAKFLFNKSDKLKKKEEEIWDDILNYSNDNKLVFMIAKPLNKTIPYIQDNFSKLKYIENISLEKDKEFLEASGISISQKNLTFLKQNIAEGWNYQSELLKLSLFKNKEEIQAEDINNYVKLKHNVNIFNFIEFLLLDKKDEAYTYYNKIMLEEDMLPIQILSIIGSQVKFFTQLKLLTNEGLSEGQIVKRLNSSPYRVKNSLKVVKRLDLDKLLAFNNKIAQYDYLVKSGNTKEKNIILNFLI